MSKQHLVIFDTTLRDGEQSPGASMTREEKLRIARQLERMRVDVIEAGFPAASPGDFEAVKAVAQAIKESTVCGLARANEKDNEKVQQGTASGDTLEVDLIVAKQRQGPTCTIPLVFFKPTTFFAEMERRREGG